MKGLHCGNWQNQFLKINKHEKRIFSPKKWSIQSFHNKTHCAHFTKLKDPFKFLLTSLSFGATDQKLIPHFQLLHLKTIFIIHSINNQMTGNSWCQLVFFIPFKATLGSVNAQSKYQSQSHVLCWRCFVSTNQLLLLTTGNIVNETSLSPKWTHLKKKDGTEVRSKLNVLFNLLWRLQSFCDKKRGTSSFLTYLISNLQILNA